MVAAVPQALVEKYGQWADKIPPSVLTALTADEVSGRLRRAQAHWETAVAQGGSETLNKALTEAGDILAAPAPRPVDTTPSALKTVGITAADMKQHGPLISRIPDDVLSKMDRPHVMKRAQIAAGEYARTGRIEDADRILSAPPRVVHSEPMAEGARAAYQRGVREDIARRYARWVAQVPDDVLAKLDAAELLDRCEYADALEQRGKNSPYPGMIHGYLDQAAKVLRSLPKADVEAEVSRLERVALLSDDQRLTQGHLARARDLRSDNPQAPAQTRVGVVGKALRPTPKATPAVLNKATVAPRRTSPAAAAPARTLSKAAAVPRKPAPRSAESRGLGLALDALEQALLLLQSGTTNKADGTASDLVVELLDTADDLLNKRIHAA